MEIVEKNNLMQLLGDGDLRKRMIQHLKSISHYSLPDEIPKIPGAEEDTYSTPEEAIKQLDQYRHGNSRDWMVFSAIAMLSDDAENSNIDIVYGENMKGTKLSKKFIIKIDKVQRPGGYVYRIMSGSYY